MIKKKPILHYKAQSEGMREISVATFLQIQTDIYIPGLLKTGLAKKINSF